MLIYQNPRKSCNAQREEAMDSALPALPRARLEQAQNIFAGILNRAIVRAIFYYQRDVDHHPTGWLLPANVCLTQSAIWAGLYREDGTNYAFINSTDFAMPDPSPRCRLPGNLGANLSG